MKKGIRHSVQKLRRFTSIALLSVLFSSEALPAAPILEVFAIPTESRVPASSYLGGTGDVWEDAEAHGDVLVTFPSRIHSSISSAEDVDVFNFKLTDTTDLTVTLDSTAPCELLLSKNGLPVAESVLPHDQSMELSDLAAGIYSLAVSPRDGTEYADYQLNILRQTDKTAMPDYSEAHIAGVVFNPKSPYRWLDLEDDKLDRGGNILLVMNYLAHWQGPVKDAVAPYYNKGDYKETPSNYIEYVDASKTSREYHIPNLYLLPDSSREGYREHWKNAVMTYGAIETGFAFFRLKPSYMYTSDQEYPDFSRPMGGHATTIVGWDDSIDRNLFTYYASSSDAFFTPEEDGAWICKDSYGTDSVFSGDGTGFFYMSYEDATLGGPSYLAAVYPAGEQVDNYSHLYSNSANGMIDLSSKTDSIILSQVFRTDKEPEMLRAAAFAVLNSDFQYEIFVRVGDGEPVLAKSGYEKYGGLHTERLDSGILIPENTEFEVITAVYLQDEDSQYLSFCCAYNIDGWISNLKKLEGISYQYYEDENGNLVSEDMSSLGIYPSIFAYTCAPTKKEQITITKIREDFGAGTEKGGNPEVSTSSNAALRTSSSAAKGYRALPNPVSVGALPLHVNLPDHYDLRDQKQITSPKHQGNSSLCWAFSGTACMESAYLKSGSNMINYPHSLNLYSEDETIQDGTIRVKLAPGEERPLSFTASLISGSETLNPGSDQIYWEITGDLNCVDIGEILSESESAAPVLTAKAAGTVTVTAVSMADYSLKTSCIVEITEKVPAKVTLDKSRLSLSTGDTYKLQASVEADEELAVIFSSDTPAIADVGADGTVLALRPGTAVITAKAGDGSASCVVTVTRSSSSDDDDDEGSGRRSYKGNSSPGQNRKAPDTTLTYDTVSGSWILNADGWQLKKADGSYPASSWERINGAWYYFKEDGYLASGWIFQNGFWYYLSKESASCGQMTVGWILDPDYGGWFYLKPDGTMAVGWNTIDGKQYYFNPESDGTKGRMLENIAAGRTT